MNEVIILLIIIIIIFYNLKNDKKIINNSSNIINKSYNYHKEKKSSVIVLNNPVPALRGYIDNYKPPSIDEKGGSKVFNDVIIDNNNLIANQVNYEKYESYRKKPLTINDIS